MSKHKPSLDASGWLAEIQTQVSQHAASGMKKSDIRAVVLTVAASTLAEIGVTQEEAERLFRLSYISTQKARVEGRYRE